MFVLSMVVPWQVNVTWAPSGASWSRGTASNRRPEPDADLLKALKANSGSV